MIEPLDGLAIFSDEKNGFNKDEVGKYIAEINFKYEKLYAEYLRLKKKSETTDEIFSKSSSDVLSGQTER